MDIVPQQAALSDEQRAAFAETGVLLVRGALDSAQLARVVAATDALMEPGADGQTTTAEDVYQHRREGVLLSPPVAALAATCGATVPLVVQLLGTNLHITNSAVIYKHPISREAIDATRSDTNWHRSPPLRPAPCAPLGPTPP